VECDRNTVLKRTPMILNMEDDWLCIKSIIKSLILHMYLLFLFGFFL
jgi:hypothetical protein